MIITVPVKIKNGVLYEADYVGSYKVIAYSDDNLTVAIEVEGD